ncbi:MAG: His/Gly/Thr/Pro-type tRNA ligase C-terminal domain-containing protein, partial [Thermoproteota archaeon]|nr:His/Gly/Thr/Pro-type tRNA ligase C-terminal domain-containing protein [Thermoproteota archaeon]
MKGVPLRINIGPKDIEEGHIEFVRRDTKEKRPAEREKLVSITTSLLAQVQESLLAKATEFLSENTFTPADFESFKSIIQAKGGFLLTGWCGQEQCESRIKEETGADIRVIPFNQNDKPATCIYCSRESKKAAIYARAY